MLFDVWHVLKYGDIAWHYLGRHLAAAGRWQQLAGLSGTWRELGFVCCQWELSPLLCGLPASPWMGRQWVGWQWLWAGSGLCVAFQMTVGSEQGQCATLTPLWAQPHAGTGKQPELWSGCVMAAPQWCDGHMILLWCLLLKDKHLAYFWGITTAGKVRVVKKQTLLSVFYWERLY